jgi:hypothetical protein
MMVEEPRLTIKFEGGDANAHSVDMRLLGRSLIGFDRIISSGVILMSERRLPRRGERAHLIVKAQEPRVGSHEIVSQLQANYGLLPLGWKIFQESGGEIIWHWVKFVLEFYGKRKDADKTLDALMETQRIHLAARDKSEERFVAVIENSRRDAMQLVEKLYLASINASAAVGPSARSFALFTNHSPRFVVDEPMADAIRSKGELEVGDLQTLSLKADGWVYHSRLLNVAHPEESGRFVYAKVRDPAGEIDGNVYANAGRDKAAIQVKAKIARRGGEIESIYIMDYCGEIDSAA